MSKLAKLREQLKQVVSPDTIYMFQGVVREITGDTCTVAIGELELSDVRLKATADGSETLLIIPAIDSNVMMISSDGSIDNLVVVKMDKVQRILFSQNGLMLDFDTESGKVGIKNNSASLKGIFDNLVNVLNGFTLSHPQGPTTGLMPPTAAAVQQFQTMFNQLLKDI